MEKKYYTVEFTQSQLSLVNEALYKYEIGSEDEGLVHNGYNSKSTINLMDRTRQAIANCKISSSRKKTTKKGEWWWKHF